MVEQKFGDISSNTAELINTLKNSQGVDIPLTKGEGWDSVILDATPNPENPDVDRTNSCTGQFSIVFGSRNAASGNESLTIGGRNTNAAGDFLLGGYRSTVDDTSENGAMFGYKNDMFGGVNSVAIGRECKIYGQRIKDESGEIATDYGAHYCFAAGKSITIGSKTQTEKIYGSAAFGDTNVITSFNSFAAGSGNNVSNATSAVIGLHLNSTHADQFICGRFNDTSETLTSPYFAVGCGQSEGDRANCFEAGVDSDPSRTRYIKIGATMLTETKLKELIGENL